jgi:hypothetical protein
MMLGVILIVNGQGSPPKEHFAFRCHESVFSHPFQNIAPQTERVSTLIKLWERFVPLSASALLHQICAAAWEDQSHGQNKMLSYLQQLKA